MRRPATTKDISGTMIGSGGDGQSGPQSRPTPDLLLPQDDGEEHRPEGSGKEEGDHDDPVNERDAEQRRVHQGIAARSAVQHEEGDEDRTAPGERSRRWRPSPSPSRFPDEPEGEEADPGRGQHARRAGRAVRPACPDVGGAAPSDDERGDADRDVDQEDPTPTGRHQQTADHRSERGGQAAGRGPGPHGAACRRSGVVGGEDQAERRRREQGAPPPPAPAGSRPASPTLVDAAQAAEASGEDGHAEEEPRSRR